MITINNSPVDNDLVDFVIKEEGFNPYPKNIGDGKITLGSGLTDPKWHKLYKQRGNRWSEADNRAAVTEELTNRYNWALKNIPNYSELPDSAKKALLSYKYNYNFNETNSPLLYKALREKNYREAANQMDATSKDPKFIEGLKQRRAREQEWFLSGFPKRTPFVTTMPKANTRVHNPYISESTRIPQIQITHTQRYPWEIKNALQDQLNYNQFMSSINLQNNEIEPFFRK